MANIGTKALASSPFVVSSGRARRHCPGAFWQAFPSLLDGADAVQPSRSSFIESWLAVKASNLSPKVCASFALVLGLTTLAGWALHMPGLLRLQPGWTPMVVNTGLGFVLGALGLWAGQAGGRRNSIISAVLGVLVVMLAVEELVVLFFDLSPALSLPELHRPLQPEYPHPGRMAPNTALAFLLFGAGLVALSRAPAKWAIGWARAAAVAVAAIGLFGVLGYALQLEYLYAWSGVVRMAAHTGLGMIALGIGMQSHVRKRQAAVASEVDQEGAAVFRTAALLLLVTASSAGIAGFAFLQDQMQRQQQDALLQVAQDRIALFELAIANRSTRADVASSNFSLADMRAFAARAEPARLDALRGWAGMLRANGFTYVAVEANGRHVTLSGHAAHSEIVVPIGGVSRGQLAWDHGFVLRRLFAVGDGLDGTNMLVTEQSLDALTEANVATNRWGKTAEMIVCGGDATSARCFPSRSQPKPFTVRRVMAGQRLPIDHALGGTTGTIVALDYRQHRVLAGYGPIGNTGLGLVVKRDIAEIYSPIRHRFQQILLFMMLLVGGGLWVMRRQLAPLLATLENSRGQARAGLARVEAAMESNLDAFFVLECIRDGHGNIHDLRYTMMNSAGEHMLGRAHNQIIGHGMCALFPVLRTDGLLAACIGVATTGAPAILERGFVLPGNHWYHMQLVTLGDGVGLTVRDITNARQAAELIRHQALHDSLTGAVNRAGFALILSGALAEARESGELIAIGLLDLDRFKDINDQLGHAAGDQLLVQTAARLRTCVRPDDTVARLGGDEFVVILRNITYPDGVEVVAKKLIAQIAQPALLDGHAVQVTISIGISVYPADGTTSDELLRAADIAMYEAKRGGRDRYALSTSSPGASE
jgi:diguanylate cyclase (GGDEF)-like protein